MIDFKGRADVPDVELSDYTIDPRVLKLIPASVAEKYKLIPLFTVGKKLTVAMAEPRNIVALDEVRSLTKLDISIVKSKEKEIELAIAEYYGIAGVVEDLIKDYERTKNQSKVGQSTSADAPVVKLVDLIIAQALNERSSDIHIEPEEKDVRIRYRVDGILHEVVTLPPFMLSPIVSRIKVLSSMDISESRVPQDGRFRLEKEKTVDFRVSTFPSVYGEKVVLRILDKSAILLTLKDIGFSDENLAKFRKVVHKPHGVVLVTGPTGSGKTTTLYAVLSEVNNKQQNIITVEDPIEYELAGITQAQVNIKAGLTFASALRSILRQDPDIILIGEIRDMETAEIAVQAAMTGHLVLSTLHTNDAVSALTRLIDVGVEPFLISSSVEAVLAQRLVRVICTKCKEEVGVPENIKERFPDLKVMYRGVGCKSCKNTGYKGRCGIFELLITDETVRKMVGSKAGVDEIKKYAVSQGMKTLFLDGLGKVKAGITSLDEVLRVTELEQI